MPIDLVSYNVETATSQINTDNAFNSPKPFSRWLDVVADTKTRHGATAPVKMHAYLIDNFIKTNPTIPPVETTKQSSIDIAANSANHSDALISDTLARIYIKQGYFEKAIAAYEKLILKIPEKNAYFAAQICSIKETIKQQE
ncbi:MAG: hypothetical protein HC896_01935 [Bacteroidales bacterium]|nr:hypothetical protein [Bacteroidales bacterium]